MAAGSERRHARHWLTAGFTDLAARVAAKTCVAPDFDVLIIGSGYGGSIAAHHLAHLQREGKRLSIGVLERGREYVEGEFPAEGGDLPRHTRVATAGASAATGVLDGLFDLRVGPEVCCLVASGVGGGSLINAGVMIRPLPEVFDRHWPAALGPGALDDDFADCEALLGAAPIADKPDKYESLDVLGQGSATPAAVTIASRDEMHFNACNHCGNCATGCNFGAKRSLDAQLLAAALAENDAVECFTGATAERVERCEHGNCDCRWIVHVSHTAKGLRDKFPAPTPVRARWVIIAAGAFGSTELLMKSRSERLALSDKLGKQFSTNGDMLAAGYDQTRRAGARATGAGPRTPATGTGPTITGVLDYRRSDGVLLEEMNVPWPIRRFFDETMTTANTAHNMGRIDGSWHRSGDLDHDPYAIDDAALDRTSVWALMGDDGTKGHLELAMPSPETEGTLGARWPGIAENSLFDDQMNLLDRLTRRSGLGGRIIPNPLWRPLPDSMSALTGDRNGSVFTVHPLGGCPMGDSGKEGVVDDCGRVFVGESAETHDGLVVLDGSVIPRALGANPALTISAVSLRAIRSLSIIWGFRRSRDATTGRALPARPRYRRVTDTPSQPTEIDVHERLVGQARIVGLGDCTLELTLASRQFPIERLTGAGEKRLDILPTSRLRIFERDWYAALIASDPTESLEARLDETALVVANVEGSLDVFRRQFSDPATRTLRTLWAWWLNRGMRDLWQLWFRRTPDAVDTHRKPWKGVRYGPALASRGGERRTLEYRLEVTGVEKGEATGVTAGDLIEGYKRIAYERASNPLRQLMDMRLTRFPGLTGRRAVLSLDPGYLARIGIPLVRVVSQRDTPALLADLAALGGYLARMLLSIHAWSFRLPDRPTTAPMRRLPGRLPNVPVFEQYHIPHPQDREQHVPAVLTRYRRPRRRPVLFIHGYSASGTTFAHECLSPSAAEYLWHEDHDVWVLDLRTSPGLVTATEPWTFEQVADTDIPLAVDHIWRETGQSIDVVAHCMGAAMFSLAVLAEDDKEHPLRTRLRERIRKVVLTQVGPGVVFTPANTFRAYMMSYLKHFLALTRFDFRVDTRDRMPDRLLDRLLNLLPYPPGEFRHENPLTPWKRTEFVAIRHRMDLLYGRDFELTNVTSDFLKNIDAMFGPLNLDTVSQAMLFTRWKNITNKAGRNRYYLRDRIRDHWRFPTLSLHGTENGLASVQTLARNRQVLTDAGVDYRSRELVGFGHQDIWVSSRSEQEVFPEIAAFLNEASGPAPVPERLPPLVARPPFLGPILSSFPDGQGRVVVWIGTSPNLARPTAIALVEVRINGDLIEAIEPMASRHQLIEDFEQDERGMIRLEINAETTCLVLVLYDEHPALLDATFGDAAIEMEADDHTFEPGDPARFEQAIRSALKLPGLETGVVTPPSLTDPAAVTVAFGSCQYPAGLLDEVPAYASWRHMADRIAAGHAPDMLLLLGDQVYVDSTAGLFDPVRLSDRYRIPYERWLSADPVQMVLGRVPTYSMLDDHELENDFEPLASGDHECVMKAGERAFRSYQFEPGRRRDPDKFWGPLDDAPLPVFMLNSRTDRGVRDLTAPQASQLLSREQMTALQSWLGRAPADQPKIITSGSLLLPRHQAPAGGQTYPLALDGWDGYPASLDEVLAFIAANRIPGVVFFSGDEHRPLVATAGLYDGERRLAVIHSVHTAALYAPIPFANAVAEDFLLEDRFDISGGFECRLEAQVIDGSFGFTTARFEKSSSAWALHLRFEGSGEETCLTLD